MFVYCSPFGARDEDDIQCLGKRSLSLTPPPPVCIVPTRPNVKQTKLASDFSDCRSITSSLSEDINEIIEETTLLSTVQSVKSLVSNTDAVMNTFSISYDVFSSPTSSPSSTSCSVSSYKTLVSSQDTFLFDIYKPLLNTDSQDIINSDSSTVSSYQPIDFANSFESLKVDLNDYFSTMCCDDNTTKIKDNFEHFNSISSSSCHNNDDSDKIKYNESMDRINPEHDVMTTSYKFDAHGMNILYGACKNGYLKEVMQLCDKDGYDVFMADRWGRQPIHVVCEYGHSNICDYMISKHGCHPLVTTLEGYTAIHYAIRGRHTKLAKYLLSSYPTAVTMASSSGLTPLLLACKTGNLELAHFLLDRFDSDLMAVDHKGVTCLAYTARSGCVPLMIYLLSMSPTVRALLHTTCDDGYTVLHYACLANHFEMVKYLLRHSDIDRNKLDIYGNLAWELSNREDLQRLCIVSLNPTSDSVTKITPSVTTKTSSNCQMSTGLVESMTINYEVLETQIEGWEDNNDDDSTVTVFDKGPTEQILTNSTSSVPVISPMVSPATSTHLPPVTPTEQCCATSSCEIRSVTDVVSSICPPANASETEKIFFYIQQGNLLELQLLLNVYLLSNNSIDMIREGSTSRSMLHVACLYGHLDIVQYLVEQLNFNMYLSDTYGILALHYACKAKHVEIVRYLVNRTCCA